MNARARRFVGKPFGVVGVLFVVAAIVAIAATSTSGAPATKCGTLDGKFDVGTGTWVGGVQAPGITIQSASGQRVVFTVENGLTLHEICVKTGRELNDYAIDPSLPVSGPRTVTVSKVGSGLSSISFDTEVSPPCGSEVTAPDVSFGPISYIDPNRAGGEPVSVVGQDGAINVSAHAGTTHVYKNPQAIPGIEDFGKGYWNQTLNWRSTDGGATWKYVGFAGLEEGPFTGPHSVGSTGFSDPDYAMDQAGNIYNVEIDLANDAVYKSVDDGQSYPIAHPLVAPGDRPWLTALEPDEVFLYVNSLPKGMYVTRDPDMLVWQRLLEPPVTSKSLPDPRNPDDGMIGPVGLGRFAISEDNALTWKTFEFGTPAGARGHLGPVATQFFGVLGVDNAGNVYQAAAGGYGDEQDADGAADDPLPDTFPNGEVAFTYYERDTGATNAERIEIPTPHGDALWPWIIAGDDGRVALVWYQTLEDANGVVDQTKFYIFAAVTHNAHGTTVECSDGSTKVVPPQFTVMNVSGRPIHEGHICLEGTTCNAEPDFELGDRRLGDFVTVNYDLDGNLFIVSGDTLLNNPVGGPKPVANPIFIKQTAGDRMIEEPIAPRETRDESPPLVLPNP